MASTSLTTLEINLDKATRVYHQNENLTGHVTIRSKTECKHEGVTISVEGTANIQPNPRSTSFFDSFYSSSYIMKPIKMLNYSLDVSKGGKFYSGRTDIPFELPLRASGTGEILYETYHGVFLSVQYILRCDIRRSLLSKDIQESVEFYIEYEDKQFNDQVPIQFDIRPQPMKFVLTPESLESVDRSNTTRREHIPKFQISGQLDSYVCKISEPFTGEFTVDHCDAKIRSIELQLVRVETCGNMNSPNKDYVRDATEVQNIQIGEGDVERGIKIPVYMIFPRLFTCPTLKTGHFRIEFEINLVIIFEDNHLITENFPIKLIRSVNQPISL